MFQKNIIKKNSGRRNFKPVSLGAVLTICRFTTLKRNERLPPTLRCFLPLWNNLTLTTTLNLQKRNYNRKKVNTVSTNLPSPPSTLAFCTPQPSRVLLMQKLKCTYLYRWRWGRWALSNVYCVSAFSSRYYFSPHTAISLETVRKLNTCFIVFFTLGSFK